MGAVTAPQTLEKHPGESLVYAMEYGPWSANGASSPGLLTTSESLVSGTCTALPSGLTIGTVTVVGTQLQARISGGANGTTYRTTWSGTTNQSNTRVVDGMLKVSDL
jgi:hypothetical protein